MDTDVEFYTSDFAYNVEKANYRVAPKLAIELGAHFVHNDISTNNELIRQLESYKEMLTKRETRCALVEH